MLDSVMNNFFLITDDIVSNFPKNTIINSIPSTEIIGNIQIENQKNIIIYT
jgi:hypothetical protein